ncbi:hypothetical protein ASC85_27055 [Pseudomonas sp. Root401]|nr:hypothetical protein ASC85_27055 [Pseudomonas sp. Root401]
MELAKAIDEGLSAETALVSLLLKPVRIVIDEFQRMVDTGAGVPFPRVAAFIERVSKRAAPGRLLLLSHHSLDRTFRWGERVAFKTLEGLSPEEGAHLLGQLLEDSRREGDISPERRPEISRWLGGNPRAIRVLVGCLEQEALDDLTGVVPEAWEARDQDVSQSLISKLERELLVRALENLDGASASALEGLAVYRKSMDLNGISLLLPSELKLAVFLAALSSRFLLQQRGGWYTLNPVVREISLHRLKSNTRATHSAHTAAAGYYTRHFTAKQIQNAGKLGGAFVEARYHLVQANRMEELYEIAQRFGHHLCLLYGWSTPEARDVGRRDEIIAVLSAYLQEGGPKSMEYYLARLLYSRRRPEDLQRALEHARKCTGPQSPAAAWVLRLRLEADVDGIEAMLMAANSAFEAVPADAALSEIYFLTAEQLTLNGRSSEAINLLEEGITKIPPEKGLCDIFLALAELLTDKGEIDNAILLLRNGLVTIPAQNNLFTIYIRIAKLFVTKGDVITAIELLKDGIDRIPPSKNLHSIFIALADTFADDEQIDEAVKALELGLQKIPTGPNREELRLAHKRLSDAASNFNSAVLANQTLESLTIRSEAKPINNTEASRRLCIIAVGTEWESRHGGLSTLNRNLCIELAAVGHRVICMVPEASEQERTEAEQAGVHLLTPDAEPGLSGTDRLLLNMLLPENFVPDLIIGHDRKTGPHAKVLTQKYDRAKFVLFVHTRPESIEWYKDKLGPDDQAYSAEERRVLQTNLASSAAIVVGVGPTLTLAARSLVYLAEPTPLVHQLDPGYRAVTRPSNLPPEIVCLLLGRAEDYTLKGLDIAAKALGEVTRRGKLPMPPKLIVRGAPAGTGQELRNLLVQFGGGKLDVEVRNYSHDTNLLLKDIQMASLVLMPSRSEGFGLVALEAVAAKTPVLVSDRSGFASLLKDKLGQSAQYMIVDTHDDLDESAKEWERSIEYVLLDRKSAFARAETLQTKLTEVLNWTEAVRQLEAAWSPLFD